MNQPHQGAARRIRTHEGLDADRALTVFAMDAPDANGASRVYSIGCGNSWADLKFQKGPPETVGPRGVTIEALLAVSIDRLAGFQSGPLSCAENHAALNHLRSALEWLHARTRDRIERGVEGRTEP